jgi:hypothetical protein
LHKWRLDKGNEAINLPCQGRVFSSLFSFRKH